MSTCTRKHNHRFCSVCKKKFCKECNQLRRKDSFKMEGRKRFHNTCKWCRLRKEKLKKVKYPENEAVDFMNKNYFILRVTQKEYEPYYGDCSCRDSTCDFIVEEIEITSQNVEYAMGLAGRVDTDYESNCECLVSKVNGIPPELFDKYNNYKSKVQAINDRIDREIDEEMS